MLKMEEDLVMEMEQRLNIVIFKVVELIVNGLHGQSKDIAHGLVEMELKFLHEQSWQNLKMGDKIVLAVIGKKQAFLTYRKN